MRVFQGVTGSAGQPGQLAQSLRKYGVEAKSFCFDHNKFGYQTDFIIETDGNDFRKIGRYLSTIVDDYDVFHFHMRPAFYLNSKTFHFPTFMDLVLLKAMGKVVFFHFRGSEVRRADLFAEKNPFHYVEGPGSELMKKFPLESQLKYIRYISGIVDGVFVTDPELQTYVSDSKIVPRLYLSTDIPTSEKNSTFPKTVKVVHAPSRKAIKGTNYVTKAVKDLQKEGIDFQFKLIHNVSHQEALNEYNDADIVIDQLRIGWYGVLSVEAMSLGKAVMVYIRDDLKKTIVNGTGIPPICFTNPNTIKADLKNLIVDEKLRKEISFAGLNYYKKTHTEEAVIPGLVSEYEKALRNPKPVDPVIFQEMIEYQFLEFKSAAKRSNVIPKTNIDKFSYIYKDESLKAAVMTTFKYFKRNFFHNKNKN